MSHPLIESVTAHAQMFVKLRRELQLSSESNRADFRTGDLVVGRLEQWGYKVARGLGGGIVGQLRRGAGSKRLGLRAQLQAQPMAVGAGLYAGEHFGQTAMLLAAAHYLARQGDFSGTLNLVFQPVDEETGSARQMVADGLFAQYPCDAIFAMHTMPGHPQGQLLLRDGPTMASSDEVSITLHGTGGEGAMPHQAADPVVAGAAIVMGLQSIVSRNIDPLQMAVVNVGAFEAGDSHDMVAQSATLRLGVRALDQVVCETLHRRIAALAELQALSYGMQATVEYRRRAPVLVNSPEQTSFARQVATELLGPGQVASLAQALRGSEDFAFMLEQVPGSYLLLGNGDGTDGFDDSNLPVGAAYWAMLAQCFLH